ncbi:tRNA dihydrouridine synthase DusB [uncultured Rhodoblastus sp.]|uniref:tRNA dihydrouridine synthase DusB n=1 Tax=uncultured Rhodoblastus sp. TaxID=543037 RepID=UPI0025D2D6CD|nr:tRNA dihydrouridine synthase DusB [uncultured Rhodoblastus sp.]
MVKFAQQLSSDGGDAAAGEKWRIGDLELDGRAFLAPMAGVTDLAMRRLARRFGAALVFSEMVASDAFTRGAGRKSGAAREVWARADGAGVAPHAVQLAGCEPGNMAEAARLAEAAGADLIDINMGCPAKRVVGGAAGSALMRDLDHAAALIGAVTRAVRIPVSVKMRLGWDEATRNAPELARRAELEGAKMIVVHGRTRSQFYRGEADWAAIRATVDAVTIPVVANGDCRSPRDAQRMLEQSGAQAVMIGRAALGQPWLVGDIAHFLRHGRERAALPAPMRRAAALEHYAGLIEIFGAPQGLRHARKHLAAYADVAARCGGGLDAEGRRRLVASEDPLEVSALIGRLYDPAPKAEAA